MTTAAVLRPKYPTGTAGASAALLAELDPDEIRRGEQEYMSDSNPPIVVGVDGSECSLDVLRWAPARPS